jgi:hypothetical protein
MGAASHSESAVELTLGGRIKPEGTCSISAGYTVRKNQSKVKTLSMVRLPVPCYGPHDLGQFKSKDFPGRCPGE